MRFGKFKKFKSIKLRGGKFSRRNVVARSDPRVYLILKSEIKNSSLTSKITKHMIGALKDNFPTVDADIHYEGFEKEQPKQIKNCFLNGKPLKIGPPSPRGMGSSDTKRDSARRKMRKSRKEMICFYCGVDLEDFKEGGKQQQNTATVDHINPLGCGGSNHHPNLVWACYRCNNVRAKIQNYKDPLKKASAYIERARQVEKTGHRLDVMFLNHIWDGKITDEEWEKAQQQNTNEEVR